jgi:hypothetical protein
MRFGVGVGVEVYLPLYKSYISGSCDHLSATEISMSCDRKWNGYSLVREWRRVGSSRPRGELFVGGSF